MTAFNVENAFKKYGLTTPADFQLPKNCRNEKAKELVHERAMEILVGTAISLFQYVKQHTIPRNSSSVLHLSNGIYACMKDTSSFDNKSQFKTGAGLVSIFYEPGEGGYEFVRVVLKGRTILIAELKLHGFQNIATVFMGPGVRIAFRDLVALRDRLFPPQ